MYLSHQISKCSLQLLKCTSNISTWVPVLRTCQTFTHFIGELYCYQFLCFSITISHRCKNEDLENLKNLYHIHKTLRTQFSMLKVVSGNRFMLTSRNPRPLLGGKARWCTDTWVMGVPQKGGAGRCSILSQLRRWWSESWNTSRSWVLKGGRARLWVGSNPRGWSARRPWLWVSRWGWHPLQDWRSGSSKGKKPEILWMLNWEADWMESRATLGRGEVRVKDRI